MVHPDPLAPADLVFSLHRPLHASVGECLARWRTLDGDTRARSDLVLHGEAGARLTLSAGRIAELARA